MSKPQILALGSLFLFASSALALPVTFDGTVDQGNTDNYGLALTDTDDLNTDPKFGGPDWNMDAAYFDYDPVDDWIYIALDVMGTFDRNGGDGAVPAITLAAFRAGEPPNNYEFVFTATPAMMVLAKPDGTPITTGWEAKILGDLELRIRPSLIPALDLNDFVFYARLDNMTGQPDDEISGRVPEPATLALLGLGGVVALLRRRR
jgi:hypothetical protein